MAVRHNASLTVDTTAGGTEVLGTVEPKSPGNTGPRLTVIITNAGAVTVYFGDLGLTSANYAFALAAGERIALDLYPGDTKLYALAASSSAALKVGFLGAA